MVYFAGLCIFILISLVGAYPVYKAKGKELKRDKKSILMLFGLPFASFLLCSLIYKLTCTFTVSHNKYLPWLSLIICTLSELFAVNTILKSKHTAIIRRFFVLSVVLALFEIFLCNYTSFTTAPKIETLDTSVIQSEGNVACENGSLIISSDSSLIIDEPPSYTRAIIIEQKQAYKEAVNPVEVILGIKDVTQSLNYESVRDRLTPATGKPLIMSITPYKKLYSVRIGYGGITEPLTVNAIKTANAVPFSFSFLRFFVLFAMIGFVIVVQEKNWDNILYRSKNPRQRLILQCIALICTIAASLWLCPEKTAAYDPEVRNTADPYAMTFDAFQKDQMYLDLDVDQKLLEVENVYDRTLRDESGAFAYWDLALYDGHYYCYFGVAPVLTMYYPFYWISGKLPTIAFASFIFCTLAIFFFCQLIITLVNRFVRHCNFLLLCLAIPTSVACCGVFYVLNISNTYTLPLAAGLCYLFLCLWTGITATMSRKMRKRIMLLILSGVSLSLCAMSRPGMALGALILAPFYLQILLAKKQPMKYKISQAAAFLIPVLLGGVFILTYNYMRFGSVLDFGQTYQLTVSDIHGNSLSLMSFFPMLIHYFLQLPRTRALFPYFEANFCVIYNYGKYTYLADTIGVFTYPLIPAGMLLMPLTFRRIRSAFSLKKWFIILCFGISLMIAWQDFCLGGAITRYVIDFLPLLVILSVLVLLSAVDIDHGSKTKNRICAIIFAGSLFISFLLTIGVRDSILMKYHSEIYEAVENMIVFWK